MKTNSVSPWEGTIAWVDNPRTGKSKKGAEWKSVDFAVKYTDAQNQERHIVFNAFGAEKVDKILSAPIGTTVRVAWFPNSREYNGKWWTKLDAYDITVFEEKDVRPKTTELPKDAPQFTGMPDKGPSEENLDLPF